ncbi:MAG TPA: M14 family zinc carboxypeptidase, partial [Polyangia bacterium]|nr:M14 family zinc carboxypeptidase [Polyangia bacterium]
MRARGLLVALALAVLPALGASARAAPLARGRFTAPNAQALARAWGARGLDVLEGSVTSRTLEVVAAPEVLEGLRGEDRALEVLERGHPRAATLLALTEPAAVPPDYESYEALTARAAALCARRPAVCQVVDLTATLGAPATFEGRHIQGVKVSDNVALDEDEPSVLLVGAHHARELATPVVALAALAHLIDGYGQDA